MSDIQTFTEVTATFRPRKMDTLRPRAQALIGWRGTWRCLWAITEDDDGPYVGQHAWEPVDYDGEWSGWVPSEDLFVGGEVTDAD